ncbi:GNAT family N-acetyltransferase [Phenylobacterium sp.]|uniref:GNAT family N-acetyltransferase n=1 Tax=Phenylobacterium sp. TaxID=1871053 RepID=UPI0026006880|nr:N-acetyltransferase [Phenylobacterium sp.]MCA3719843.1 N-acetyltransferase [Phenylobacterium sp.]
MGALSIRIRPEEERDHPAIHDLTRRAFAPMAFAAGDEQELIEALRRLGALSLSLVAEQEGRVVGHVALSPVTHESGAEGWFGLGPISVEPALQRQGVGGALIAEVRLWLAARDARGCVLTGDPRYYPRHGFRPAPEHAPQAEPAEFFMVLSLAGAVPAGRFGFHPAFHA